MRKLDYHFETIDTKYRLQETEKLWSPKGS